MNDPMPQRILVIRRDNIGDLICTTPLIETLRSQFPNAHIAALVNSYNAPALDNNPHLDAVHVYTKAKHRAPNESALSVYWQRWKLIRQLRKQRFDVALLAGTEFSTHAWRLAKQLKPKEIWGYSPNENAPHFSLDKTLTPNPQDQHEVERVHRLSELFSIHQSAPDYRIYPNQNLRESIAFKHQLDPNQLYLGVHISARKPSNRWPIEHHITFIRRLLERHSKPILLFWSPGSINNPTHPGDDEHAQHIMNTINNPLLRPIITHSLPELIAAMDLCNKVVCSDGGAMHIAAALNKPVVCFFGQSTEARWKPWGDRHVILKSDDHLANPASVECVEQNIETS